MSGMLLTEVSAEVDADREDALVASFRELRAAPFPDGLLRTELLKGDGGLWRVQTLWRDRAALEAMRAGPEMPAALRLFRDAGAQPRLVLLEVLVAAEPGRSS